MFDFVCKSLKKKKKRIVGEIVFAQFWDVVSEQRSHE